MTNVLLATATAAIYAAIASLRRRRGPKPLVPAARLALILALGLHGALLVRTILLDAGIDLGVGQALSLIVWLTLLSYGASPMRTHLEALHPVVLPVAAIGALLPVVIRDSHLLPWGKEPLFQAHLIAAFIAYALFTMAALHGVITALAEKRLKSHELERMPSLPPLMTMEKHLFRLIGAGFGLLTLTLGSGILFSEQIFGKPLSFATFSQHKTVFALLSWLIYAWLLIGRHFFGWRGRRALAFSLSGFAALVLAYLGTKIVLELVLTRY